MAFSRLVLEIVSGPLDGHTVTLDQETVLGSKGDGPLVFPRDEELAAPHVRLQPDDDGWKLTTLAPNRITLVQRAGGQSQPVTLPVTLKVGDGLAAGRTWLIVVGTLPG